MMFNDLNLTRMTRTGLRALLPVLVASISACEQPTESGTVAAALTEMEADAVMFGMEDHLTTDGVRSGVIRADTAYIFNDSSVVNMWGVDMTLFHENGTERARVTSERGTFHRLSEKMVARGNVVLVMDGGDRRVESAELHYDPSSDRIWSDSSAVYTHGGRQTRGTCFRSDLEFTSYTVCDIRGSAEVGGGG